ncbi:putative DUF341 family oxidoreductase [Dothidotthia symphoricarpi CBS 119687]|uniref:Putative DUF341 family oxidoreductase n=1 Tax=Dothidotthia symphoricarpi CBS 119687 TaxID=1392245 RepID=A0A6A6A209_9PLEO|nr:putative DUF341 family oxidoreductase [Dothidotthia symphoricarpi CBS 119687]KAF2125235.1 putative DUF341 family oxidoreductase [Dothidotthia symphoricarpi CBS 119687]
MMQTNLLKRFTIYSRRVPSAQSNSQNIRNKNNLKNNTMQFLGFHGAISNADYFGIQLAPLEKELERDQAASFHFMNAPILGDPPYGVEKYFGNGPYRSWFCDGAVGSRRMLERVRDMPTGDNSEEIMRKLRGKRQAGAQEQLKDNLKEVMDSIYATLKENPQIEGVIGYSEGSCLAASLILDEIRREQETGQARQIKCAIFITGWPPLASNADFVLSDESALKIDVPTLHIVGANDPYKHGALAMFNVCDENTATLFDTGKGHTIPRSGRVIQELGDAVREMIGSTRSQTVC